LKSFFRFFDDEVALGIDQGFHDFFSRCGIPSIFCNLQPHHRQQEAWHGLDGEIVMALLKDRAHLRACGQEPTLVQKRDGLADRGGMPEQSGMRRSNDGVVGHAIKHSPLRRNLAVVRSRQNQERRNRIDRANTRHDSEFVVHRRKRS
jgi:hypothetical protein